MTKKSLLFKEKGIYFMQIPLISEIIEYYNLKPSRKV